MTLGGRRYYAMFSSTIHTIAKFDDDPRIKREKNGIERFSEFYLFCVDEYLQRIWWKNVLKPAQVVTLILPISARDISYVSV